MSEYQNSIPTTEESIFEQDYFKETQEDILAYETKKTMQCLLIIGAILFASDLLAMMMYHLFAPVTLGASLVFPALFTGLAFFSRSKPKLAMIGGMVLVLAIIVLAFLVTGSGSLISGFLVKAIIIYLIIKGWRHASEADTARANLATIA
jgi:hypothetical protein